jgi:hypothetical protein
MCLFQIQRCHGHNCTDLETANRRCDLWIDPLPYQIKNENMDEVDLNSSPRTKGNISLGEGRVWK